MIGWYAHHHGGGHLARVAAVAKHMRGGLCGLSSCPVPPLWQHEWLELARDDEPSVQGRRDDPGTTAHGVLHWVPAHHPGLAQRNAQIVDWAARRHPQALVVDVSVEVALLARLSGVPTVVVALPGRRDDRAHRLAYDSADALIAPWPREAHALDWPRHWLTKTQFVGGLSRYDEQLAATPSRRRTGREVVVLWGSGGEPLRGVDLARARACTPGWSWTVLDPARSHGRDVWTALLDADVVVCHGGQNAVAEVAAARRPAVVIAQPRPYQEQAATAAALDRLGIATGLHRWPEGSDWPGLLERALERGGSGWKAWSTGHAARDVAAFLEKL